jgi:SAM-dependent methyltransferase
MEARSLTELLSAPRAPAIAAKFGCCPDIHRDDFIFEHSRSISWCGTQEEALHYYFMDGQQSAKQLDELIKKFHPNPAGRLSLLEFASGYGLVSRHLKKYHEAYRLVACDIHDKAVEFLRDRIGIEAVLSASDPDRLPLNERFDVVFALSFFSHMPPTTWGRWVLRLFEAVADGGLLIFTTHGRVGWKQVNRPPLAEEGYWFSPVSEQKDLPVAEYGTMIVTPRYVLRQLERNVLAKPIFFQEAFWWGVQDTYIIQRPVREDAVQDVEREPAEPARAKIAAPPTSEQKRVLEGDIAALCASSSWRLTAPLRALAESLQCTYRRMPVCAGGRSVEEGR